MATYLDAFAEPGRLWVPTSCLQLTNVKNSKEFSFFLQSTAVLSLKMDSCEKPLSCSLQSLEVFSCTLGLEEETALSIIDPVTVNVELNIKEPKDSGSDRKHILEVAFLKLIK